jgi:hypothetical protein
MFERPAAKTAEWPPRCISSQFFEGISCSIYDSVKQRAFLGYCSKLKGVFMIKVALAFVFLIISAAAYANVTPSQGHTLLCKAAVKAYPESFASVKDCNQDTDLQVFDDPEAYELSFASCKDGLWVTLRLDLKDMEITEGSTGVDADTCE